MLFAIKSSAICMFNLFVVTALFLYVLHCDANL